RGELDECSCDLPCALDLEGVVRRAPCLAGAGTDEATTIARAEAIASRSTAVRHLAHVVPAHAGTHEHRGYGSPPTRDDFGWRAGAPALTRHGGAVKGSLFDGLSREGEQGMRSGTNGSQSAAAPATVSGEPVPLKPLARAGKAATGEDPRARRPAVDS